LAFISLDSPSCEVPCWILHSVVYRDVTRQAKGLYRLKHEVALKRGLAYLSRCNSGWFCHRKRPSRLGFNRRLHGKDVGATGTWVGERQGSERDAAAHRTVATASNRACGKAGNKGKKGPAMLLTATWSFWGTCATAESGGAAGGRGAVEKAAAWLRFARRGSGGCGFCGTKGAGRRLYRAAKEARRAGPRHRAGGSRAAARLKRESKPGSSSRMGMTPTGGPRLSARERRGGES
jgi:hypothetical protein